MEDIAEGSFGHVAGDCQLSVVSLISMLYSPILANFGQDAGCDDDEYWILRLGADWDVRRKRAAWCTHGRCRTLMYKYCRVLNFV
jgi:hypothetical protein